MSPARLLVGCVAAAALLPPIALGLGIELGLERSALLRSVAEASGIAVERIAVAVHSLLEWGAAVLAAVVALFALGRARTVPEGREASILAWLLPAVAVLAGLAGLATWLPATAERGEGLALLLSTGSRWLLSSAVVAGLLLVLRPTLRSRSLGLFCAVLNLAAGILAVLAWRGALTIGVPVSPILPRPWDLPPALMLLATGLIVLARPSEPASFLRSALAATLVPLTVCHLAASFGSLVFGDGPFVVSHLTQLVALGTLVAGLALDYGQAQHHRRRAETDVVSAQRELLRQTRELERVDRELVYEELRRRRVERSLRILERAVEKMSMGVTVSDMQGAILYVNPADARMHGFTVEELLGKSRRRYGGSAKEEPPPGSGLGSWERETVNVTKDGHEFPVRLVSDTVLDAEGQPIAMVTLCEDISERRRIRAALDRRERILEAVAVAAESFLPDVSWEAGVGDVLESLAVATSADLVALNRVTESGTIGTRLEGSWTALTGSYQKEGSTLGRLGELPPRWKHLLRLGQAIYGPVSDQPEREQEAFKAAGIGSFVVLPVTVRGTWVATLGLADADPERPWSEAEIRALRTAASSLGAALQRQLAKEELASNEARYRAVLENASDLIQSVSPDGSFLFVNRAWKEALGYSDDEVSEMTCWEVVHRDHHERCKLLLEDLLSGSETSAQLEVVFVTRDGREITVEGNVDARLEEGLPVAAQGIFRDITARKIVDRMKQEFVATVSHELRTPLTSIIASLGILESEQLASRPERSRELLAVAHRNSTRLLQLINDLLDLQKLVAGKMTFRREPVVIAPLVGEALTGIQSFADSLGIRLSHQIGNGLSALADRDRLIQVLDNLLSNAIKFSPKGEAVEVRCGRHGGWVRISVCDHGPGIPEDFRHRLFEQFTQVDSSATRSSGGSGLGLSIVRGLVEGMGGRIDVTTEIGQGTEFFVDLPAAGA